MTSIPFLSAVSKDGPHGQERVVAALWEEVERLAPETGALVGDFEYHFNDWNEHFERLARHLVTASGSTDDRPDFEGCRDSRAAFVSWLATLDTGPIPMQVVEVEPERIFRRMLVLPASIDVAEALSKAGVDATVEELSERDPGPRP